MIINSTKFYKKGLIEATFIYCFFFVHILRLWYVQPFGLWQTFERLYHTYASLATAHYSSIFALSCRSEFATSGFYPPKSWPQLSPNHPIDFPPPFLSSVSTPTPFAQLLLYIQPPYFPRTLTTAPPLVHLLTSLLAIFFPPWFAS